MSCCVAGSKYERRRSKTLLKVKTFYDEDPCLYYPVLDHHTVYPSCQLMLFYAFRGHGDMVQLVIGPVP